MAEHGDMNDDTNDDTNGAQLPPAETEDQDSNTDVEIMDYNEPSCYVDAHDMEVQQDSPFHQELAAQVARVLQSSRLKDEDSSPLFVHHEETPVPTTEISNNHQPENEDSSSLFVRDDETSQPTANILDIRQPETDDLLSALSRDEEIPTATASKPGRVLPNMPPPPRPPTMRKNTSVYEKIKQMQVRTQKTKETAAQRRYYPSLRHVDNEDYLEAVMSPIRPGDAQLPDVDGDGMENRQALAEFQRQKRRYDKYKEDNGGVLTFKQSIEWMKIRGSEDSRRSKRARDLAKAKEEDWEPGQPPDRATAMEEVQDDDDEDMLDIDSIRPRKRRQNPHKTAKEASMLDAEIRSMQVALQAADDVPRKAKKNPQTDNESIASGPSNRGHPKASSGRTPKSKSKATSKKSSQGGGGGQKTGKSRRELDQAVRQATSLFNSNVFEQQADEDAAEQPTFRSRRKADALKELIASVPLEQAKKAKTDMNTLLNATKDFDGKGSVKAHDGGLWLVKGMHTALKPYQVLGSAFMRRRENETSEPRGGLMADQMGLGKTLMMLANIVNGQPPRGAKGPRTTLLVASPSLLTQWKNEIEQHTSTGFKIMRYGSGARIDSNEADTIIGSHDIVLTTYQEVMKSYPKNEPPIECQTAEQKIAWWKDTYDKGRGVLHRMMFLRVVLDEAQAIKNHTGRTSIACRALMARYKWALSGTPILNSLTELYAYFKFLGVPHTGSFKIFKHNYCGVGDKDSVERLLLRLAQFMIRRTHADVMFGAPILKLPHADQATAWCAFNPVERCIYDIVQSRFAKRINAWAKTGELDSSYNNALVMLLRLRQLTAHVLMLQFVMRDLLEREDIERIRQIVEQPSSSDKKGSQTILAVRRQLDKLADDAKKKRTAKEATGKNTNASNVNNNLDMEEEMDDLGNVDNVNLMEDDITEKLLSNSRSNSASGGSFGKEFNFKPFLNSLRDGESWKKAKEKARCYMCGNKPSTPYISSCGHLICLDPCLEVLNGDAAEEGVEHVACKTCGQVPTYHHPCEPDEEDQPDTVAQGTRAGARKKSDQQRKQRESEDIREDWLAAAGEDVLPSAKTIAVKSQILNWMKENHKVKIIIYTQFLAMVRILARICQKEGWKTQQYHGKLSLAARDKAIDQFANDEETSIMLASLRCGGLGLNLTMASKVIILDPWWNNATEQQAFCRVFRIGQKQQTFMSRMCVSNTVDERLIAMQERKQVEIDSIMEDDGSTVKKISLRDLMRLFGNLEEDNDGKPFILVDNPDPMGGFRADRDDEGYADDF